jgi:dTDP-4-dehydrorhamnose reductase
LGGHEKLAIRVDCDVRCSAIAYLLTENKTGIYHIVNSEPATWKEFASEIFRQTELDVRVDGISTEEFGAPAPRPRYSVLDNSKYCLLGGPPLPPWSEALTEYLARKASEPTA